MVEPKSGPWHAVSFQGNATTAIVDVCDLLLHIRRVYHSLSLFDGPLLGCGTNRADMVAYLFPFSGASFARGGNPPWAIG